MIRRLAIGLPSNEPAISPKVAAVKATVRASGYPRTSILGATAADVPCPPVREGDAVSSARSGLIPTTSARPTANTF
ncbi:hypothetical protein CNEO4_340065 [Clostridium neonatale]|nr:hypothetical protein CNEO4_340065 [Clostridium neonatale]